MAATFFPKKVTLQREPCTYPALDIQAGEGRGPESIAADATLRPDCTPKRQ